MWIRFVPRICCVTCYALVCTIVALLCVCERAARLRATMECATGVLFASVLIHLNILKYRVFRHVCVCFPVGFIAFFDYVVFLQAVFGF